MQPLLNIALLNPEIPGNTGNIGRLAIGVGARLHLVHPLGFSLSEKAVRRAGIDHWRRVQLQEHDSVEAFLAWCEGRRVHAFTRSGARSFTQIRWEPGDVLLFGCESVGLPDAVTRRFDGWRIPLVGGVRSLNLANAVAVATYQGLQHLNPELFASEAP